MWGGNEAVDFANKYYADADASRHRSCLFSSRLVPSRLISSCLVSSRLVTAEKQIRLTPSVAKAGQGQL